MKMKLLILLLLAQLIVQGQTWAEWTEQNRTQLRYLREQIAANKFYIDVLQKGYAIAKNGLTLIGDIKDGDFQLHRNYFGSLSMINPSIRELARLPEIVQLVTRPYQSYKINLQHLQSSGQFNADEIASVDRVFRRMLEDMDSIVEELIGLLSADHLVMKDALRIERLKSVQLQLVKLSKALQSYARSNLILAVQRLQESNNIKVLSKLYNLQP